MSVSRLPTFCVCGDHAFAGLSRGFVTLVSPDDAALLVHKWTAGYPRVGAHRKQDGILFLLHRVIMAAPQEKAVDHINCDRFDNRRVNLRLCSVAENNRNSRKRANGANPFKGVYPSKTGRFVARIRFNGQLRSLGTFDNPEDARQAYAKAAHRLHGEFARVA